ncbi:hypothetical protein ACP_1831 [Acidobacterium capsulatum ATCC 51196]|uniref:Uncharacterized protein n=1 Tax=Acidobacterium capsulatum (strain ATCC 51196 / DSM 11244 / BCRC 80197 / JCM 7670 / NBRC 15755 / NCIMB 13165 / 161) TaxID=240015 RepID=C1F7U9_ACIC5|nr:hypothetical protein ACP_1831 [Acidobacterium capsulatum ATCC 51196]
MGELRVDFVQLLEQALDTLAHALALALKRAKLRLHLGELHRLLVHQLAHRGHLFLGLGARGAFVAQQLHGAEHALLKRNHIVGNDGNFGILQGKRGHGVPLFASLRSIKRLPPRIAAEKRWIAGGNHLCSPRHPISGIAL